ncbi:HU family DNA-binding protein [Bacteroides sp. 51]|uniref:HU family DNA-binding protein n=1 Tax=Bacteroides sp. 51 TaxID=2302938 RepID=UPI0013D395EE|nr:HU family DNA-binding protein [Bacteroides sp. 51]NDV82993.1 DNA-binding protein [Bacteroides sp. 51]
MTLFYKARQSTLESKDGKKKWYPILVKTGKAVSLLEMATEVAEKSSLTPGDTLSVSQNLMMVMSRHLMNSRSVRLDGLGTFTVIGKAKGTGVDTEEEVSSLQFNGLRVRFTPEYTRNNTQGTTRAMFSKVEYAKWGDSKSTKGNSSDNGGDDDEEVIDPGF